MKRIKFILLLLIAQVTVYAQTYVWKDGMPVVEDPDSITFVKPDMGAQVVNVKEDYGSQTITYLYLTKDYEGKPLWQSAVLYLSNKQVESKYVGKMALYNHYTIMSSDEAPSAGKVWDLQAAAIGSGMSVVSPDFEGFGYSSDRMQAYCFAEVNARASIDALLAAREWLVGEGYTLSDTLVNYGYSQGGQTTVAVLKLSQTEYKDKVRFMMSIAGDGPYDLSLTYHKFLAWKKWGLTAALPLTVITLNELFHLDIDYKNLFLPPLDTNWKMWFLSKKFDLTEASQLIAQDSIQQYIQPVYCDSTSAEVRSILTYSDRLNVTNGWTPDSETQLKMYHSQNDDVVPFENSRNLYRFFLQNDCGKVVFDSTTLNSTHLGSATTFLFSIMSDFQNL